MIGKLTWAVDGAIRLEKSFAKLKTKASGRTCDHTNLHNNFPSVL